MKRQIFRSFKPFVDEALDRLDQQVREIVISHYLRGETQAEIAGHFDIDQSTVSRRLAQGLEDVRNHLRRIGILTTVTMLMNVFEQNTAEAAPANLTEMVAKVGLAGVGWTAGKSAVGSLGLLAATFVAALGNILLYLVCEGWTAFFLLVVEFALISFPPTWFRELSAAWLHGRDLWSHPFFPMKRWTWTIPPREWKQRLAAWSFIGFVWGFFAAWQVTKDRGHWGKPAFFVLLGAFCILQAIRLGIRVWRFRGNLPLAVPEALPVSGKVETWERVAVTATSLMVGVASLVALPRDGDAGFPLIPVELIWSISIGCVAIVLWNLRSRWTSSRMSQHMTRKNCSGEPLAPPSVKNKYRFAVLAILVAASLALVSQSLFAATVSQVVMREPYIRLVPLMVVVFGGFAMILTVVFLFRLHLLRAHVARWGYLLLVATGVALLGGGAGLTGYGGYMARTMPSSAPPFASSVPVPKPPLSPSELAFQEKLRQLCKKYAREIAAVVPSTMPGTFALDSTTPLMMFPLVREAADFPVGDIAEELGLPAGAPLNHVQALLIQSVCGTMDVKPLILFTYTFVCESRHDAEELAQAWGSRAYAKGISCHRPLWTEQRVPVDG